MTDWRDIREQFPITANYTYLNAAAAGPLALRHRRQDVGVLGEGDDGRFALAFLLDLLVGLPGVA